MLQKSFIKPSDCNRGWTKLSAKSYTHRLPKACTTSLPATMNASYASCSSRAHCIESCAKWFWGFCKMFYIIIPSCLTLYRSLCIGALWALPGFKNSCYKTSSRSLNTSVSHNLSTRTSAMLPKTSRIENPAGGLSNSPNTGWIAHAPLPFVAHTKKPRPSRVFITSGTPATDTSKMHSHNIAMLLWKDDQLLYQKSNKSYVQKLCAKMLWATNTRQWL